MLSCSLPSQPLTGIVAVGFSSVCLVLESPLAAKPVAGVQSSFSASPVAAVQTDPFASAIFEASRRFGVPEHWIRSVMRVESAGYPRAISHAGAMGLMQVMPATYAELRTRYRLGPDPFAIRDNILAGTAYLREMYDRYGAPGFLGAYNAGPDRWEKHLSGTRRLPGETIGYLGRLAPMLGFGRSTGTGHATFARPPWSVPILVTQGGGTGPRPELLATDGAQNASTPPLPNVASGRELFVARQAAPAAPDRNVASNLLAAGQGFAQPPNPLFTPR